MKDINLLMNRLVEITNQLRKKAEDELAKLGGGYGLNNRPVVNTLDA